MNAATEKAFTRQLMDLARMLGWEVYHPWLSVRSPRGWPDVALCKPPRLILAELKTQKGKLSEHQSRWIELLDACPAVEVHVWRQPIYRASPKYSDHEAQLSECGGSGDFDRRAQ